MKAGPSCLQPRLVGLARFAAAMRGVPSLVARRLAHHGADAPESERHIVGRTDTRKVGEANLHTVHPR